MLLCVISVRWCSSVGLRCLLFVVCCLLLFVCSLIVVVGWLFGVRCLLFVVCRLFLCLYFVGGCCVLLYVAVC